MINIAFELSYDGTSFYGWQKNHDLRTIEGTLETVLQQVLQHPIHLQAASRTDKGVHANGQVVQFFTEKTPDCQKLQKSLNSLLPKDLVVNKLWIENPEFHPTLDTLGKCYRYQIHHTLSPFLYPYSWYVSQPLDFELMKQGSELLQQRKEFKPFCNMRHDLNYETTERRLYDLTIFHHKQTTTIQMIGDHFLYKMARNIAGSLVDLGSYKLSLQDLTECQKRSDLGVTAPACGLYLEKVFYLEKDMVSYLEKEMV